jgi:hypothetical protein
MFSDDFFGDAGLEVAQRAQLAHVQAAEQQRAAELEAWKKLRKPGQLTVSELYQDSTQEAERQEAVQDAPVSRKVASPQRGTSDATQKRVPIPTITEE